MGHVEQVGEKLGSGCTRVLKEGINESRGRPRRYRAGSRTQKGCKGLQQKLSPVKGKAKKLCS